MNGSSYASRLFAATTVFFCVLAFSAALAFGQSSYPMLMSVKPLAVQIGATTECEISSRYSLHDVQDALVSGTGVRAEIVKESLVPAPKPGEKPKNDGTVKVRFIVDADAIASPRDFRLTTPTGPTTIAQIVLVRDPIVYEPKENDTRDKAAEVTLPATVCGVFEKAEDVDYFKFKAEAGQSLLFHVWAARQQDKIHDLQTHSDPLLAIRNAAGVVLDADDNTFFADPLLQYTFAQAGEYFLEMRDVRYQGNAHWQYAVEISSRPFVTTVFPLAAAPGASIEVEPIGKNIPAALGSPPKTTLAIPADAPDGLFWTQATLDGQPTNAVRLETTRLPLATETPDENNAPDKAQAIALPIAVNGRCETPADVDCYAFEAKKGDAFCFEVVARRRQSSLDAVLSILDDKGKRLTENDDLRQGRFTFADAGIDNWTAPADGRYVLEIRDLHLRGGADFVYVLKGERRTPTFRLDADTDKTLVAPGIRGVVFVRATRQGLDGPIELWAESLPPGVTAHCSRILAGANDGCIIFEAAPDAPKSVANVRIFGRATYPAPEPPKPAEAPKPEDPKPAEAAKPADGDKPAEAAPPAEPAPLSEPPKPAEIEVQAEALVLQEIYMPGGGRGHYPSAMHTLTVGEPMEVLDVTISPNNIALAPEQSQKIDVVVKRQEGFEGNITLDVMMRHLNSVYGDSLPKGVKIDEKNSKLILNKNETQGWIVLKADKDAAPVESQVFPVMAQTSINFVMKMSYAAEPVRVTVTPKP